MSLDNVPDRIYAQYRNKEKAVAWYNIARNLAVDINQVAADIRSMYDVNNTDVTVGAQLDILGRLVVISREFTALVPSVTTQVAAANMNPGLVGDSKSSQSTGLTVQSQVTADDDTYRILIKAKILKNNSYATIEDILKGVQFLLPNAGMYRVSDGEDMTFGIEFYGTLTDVERYALLNALLVPKPQGVRFRGFLEGIDYVELNDDEKMCGDEEAQCVGFIGGD